MTRECPVCGVVKPQLLFRQAFVATDSAAVDGYDVVVCQRCGCGYADGIPEQEVFDEYYRGMSKYEYHQRDGAESEYDRRRLVLTADIVQNYAPGRDLRVLDVGCATGRLLSELRNRGFAKVVGLDPSPSCAAAARRLYDIEVRTITLGEQSAHEERFDVVTMVGVLEHLRDLRVAFAHLHSVLSPEGLLYIDVPDATAFADWPNAPYQDFSTEHINFFSPTSLDNLMMRNGFRRVFLERNHREQSHATVMSNLSAIYRKESTLPLGTPAVDLETAAGLTRYISQCAASTELLHRRIDAVVQSGRAVLVWGVGTHTSRLLATSRLRDAHIVAFVDSNSRYHGKTLAGHPILGPAALGDRPEPVLISSWVFQREIADQIRNELHCSNELIFLYEI